MRQIFNLNEGWKFYKGVADVAAATGECEAVSLPHTWNATDGQDGGTIISAARVYTRKN